eukprot:1195743-Prorocentrum_minimum.AAC.7
MIVSSSVTRSLRTDQFRTYGRALSSDAEEFDLSRRFSLTHLHGHMVQEVLLAPPLGHAVHLRAKGVGRGSGGGQEGVRREPDFFQGNRKRPSESAD